MPHIHMETKWQEQGEMFRIVAENISDAAVVVDHRSIVQYVSSSIEALTGYTVDQYVGMDAFDNIHSDDRERVRRSYRQVIARKTAEQVEYRVQHSLGYFLYAETRVKPVLNGEGNVKYVVAIVKDVTERKQKEQMLDNMLDNLNAMMMSTDKDFTRLSYVFGNVEKLTGQPRQAVMEKPILMHAYMHADNDAFLMNEAKRQLDAGIPVSGTFRIMRPGQDTRWIKMTVHPYLDHAGSVECNDIICMDVTEKRLEREHRQRERGFRADRGNFLGSAAGSLFHGFAVRRRPIRGAVAAL